MLIVVRAFIKENECEFLCSCGVMPADLDCSCIVKIMVHALLPGSFDPITNGHVNIIERAAQLFDKLTLSIVYNPNKQGFLPIAQRVELISELFVNNPKITVTSCTGLLAQYAQEQEATVLVKGLRTVNDLVYELPMDHMNHHLAELETVYLCTAPQFSFISSSLVREVALLGGDISGLVPKSVETAIYAFRQDHKHP